MKRDSYITATTHPALYRPTNFQCITTEGGFSALHSVNLRNKDSHSAIASRGHTCESDTVACSVLPAMKTNRNVLLSLTAIIALVFTLVMNYLANALPLFGRPTGGISDNLPNLFVPAGITFSVWGVIYLALIGFTVYQAVVVFRQPGGPPQWWRQIIAWVVVAHLANGVWILAWHALWYEASVVIMLLLFFSLLRIVLVLGWSRRRITGGEYWLAGVPFSLYLGWISVALPANVTGLLVSWGITDLAPGAVFWAAALSAVAATLGFMALLRYRDGAYAAVIIWALVGIALKRAGDVPFLAGWAAALSVATVVIAVFAVVSASPFVVRLQSLSQRTR